MNSLNHELLIIKAKEESQLNIIKAKTESALKIEEARTKRKKQTAQVINTNIIQTQNNTINNFIVNLPSEGVISASDYKKILKQELNKLDETDAITLTYFTEDIERLPIELISRTYANEDHPQYKNVWYNKDLDTFYCVEDEEWEKAEKEKIRKIISMSLSSYYSELIKKSKIFIPKNEPHETRKLILETANKINYPESYYENVAKKALYY